MTDDRVAELTASLAAVRGRLDTACRIAGRAPEEVTLVAVSKTWPAVDVMTLAALGVTDFGESYDQEAAAKAAVLATAGVRVRWHFVGRLQRNKCRSVSTYADVVQSVDRPEVAEALASSAHRIDRRLGVLVQVDLDETPGETPSGRGGCQPVGVLPLADYIGGLAGIDLRGVMAVAPRGAPPRPAFVRLRHVAEALRAAHPGARAISAGMTGDVDDAIAEGATLVRVGTALFGDRRVGG